MTGPTLAPAAEVEIGGADDGSDASSPEGAFPDSAGSEAAVSPESAPEPAGSGGFAVRVAGFEGPFDLLLALIAKHRIEVTELALHVVTDDFIAHVRAQGQQWDLDEATSFLVIAATLLDLKAARLLPDGQVEDEDDLALLEARDLLFARLLQYRAFKEVAALIEGMLVTAARRRPRDVGLEPWQAQLLPEVLLGIGPEQFAAIAEVAFAPKPPPPPVSTEHVHAPAVSVREQAAILVERLRRRRTATFRELVTDASSTLVVVGRFLALLELYRDGVVTFDQAAALGELVVTWSGPDPEPETEPETETETEQSTGGSPDEVAQRAAGVPAGVALSGAAAGAGEDGTDADEEDAS